MKKNRIRQVIKLERTGLGEQDHIEWYEELEVEDDKEVVEKELNK